MRRARLKYPNVQRTLMVRKSKRGLPPALIKPRLGNRNVGVNHFQHGGIPAIASTSSFFRSAMEVIEFTPIIPLHTVISGVCTCKRSGCPSAGKHPHIKDFQNKATRDISIIASWAQKWPTANLGMPTGRSSGYIVLDVDPRDGGDQTLQELISKFGQLPDTVTVDTGGGGKQFYFKHPGKHVTNMLSFGPGLHLIADGGQVVLPGSLHISGMRYRFGEGRSPKDIAVSTAPQWILEHVSDKDTTSNNSNPSVNHGDYEFAMIRQLVPDLKKENDNSWRCHCPFHDDQNPSFVVSCDHRSGKWRWRCFANCLGTQLVRGGVTRHSGDYRDLLTLKGMGSSASIGGAFTDYERFEELIGDFLPNDNPGFRVARAVIKHASTYKLDMKKPIGVSYRALAQIDSKIDVVKPDGSLANRGRIIQKGKKELQKIGVMLGEGIRRGYPYGCTEYNFAPILHRISDISPTKGTIVPSISDANERNYCQTDILTVNSKRINGSGAKRKV